MKTEQEANEVFIVLKKWDYQKALQYLHDEHKHSEIFGGVFVAIDRGEDSERLFFDKTGWKISEILSKE